MPSDRPPPTVPPPRRRPTPPARPAVLTERESQISSNPPRSRGIPDEEGEDFLQKLRDVEDRMRARQEETIAEVSAVFEREVAELRAQVAARDATIQVLQSQLIGTTEADGRLNASMVQLRAEMTAIAMTVNKQQAPAQQAAAAETAQSIAKAETKMTKVVSAIVSIVTTLAATGVLAAITRSCADDGGVKPGAVQVTKPVASAVPGRYGSIP